MAKSGKIIVFFDEGCLMCNSFVRLLIKIDDRTRIAFAPLSLLKNSRQSKTCTSLSSDSVFVWSNDKCFDKSSAVIKITEALPYPWKFLSFFRIIPTPWRDRLYDMLAGNRKIFQKNYCPIPANKIKNRFIQSL